MLALWLVRNCNFQHCTIYSTEIYRQPSYLLYNSLVYYFMWIMYHFLFYVLTNVWYFLLWYENTFALIFIYESYFYYSFRRTKSTNSPWSLLSMCWNEHENYLFFLKWTYRFEINLIWSFEKCYKFSSCDLQRSSKDSFMPFIRN